MSYPFFLALDTETGGLDEDSSLLTAHFAVCDDEWNILNELELNIKPNDSNYTVNARALAINKIDLIDHDNIAITYSEAGSRLRDFLRINSQNGLIKLIPVGKNVAFDIKKINDTLLNSNVFSQYVSYKCYDIGPIVKFLKRTGKLDLGMPESLEGIANKIGINADWHTARGDNIAGIQIIKYLESL